MQESETPNFLMFIADVFNITNRGTVITGKIEKGKVSIGDTLYLLDDSYNVISEEIYIKGLEIGFSRIRPTSADEGMNVGLLINDTDLPIQTGYILMNK